MFKLIVNGKLHEPGQAGPLGISLSAEGVAAFRGALNGKSGPLTILAVPGHSYLQVLEAELVPGESRPRLEIKTSHADAGVDTGPFPPGRK